MCGLSDKGGSGSELATQGSRVQVGVKLDEYFVCWWLLGVYDYPEMRERVLSLAASLPRERLAHAMSCVGDRFIRERWADLTFGESASRSFEGVSDV